MPRQSEPKTPLLALLRACSVDERAWLAAEAGTSVSYIYQLSLCQRTPGVDLAAKLVSAIEKLHVKTRRRTPKLSLDQLASMCRIENIPIT